MTRRSTPSLLLPALIFVLLASGLAGCNRGEKPEETAQTPTTSGKPAPEAPAPITPAPGTTAPSPPTPGAPPPEALPGQPAGSSQLPAVVARVDGQEIKKEELIARAQEMRSQLARARGVQIPLSPEFYREILDGIVAHQLLLQEAKKQGISITDAEVDQMMQGFKSRFPSQEVFEKQLAASKMTEAQLRQRMREDSDTVVNKLIRKTIVPTIQVSEADARAFYDQNQQRMKTPPRVHLRHILIAVAPQAPAADREKAKQKAEDLLKQIKDGGDFAQLAAQNSNDTGSATQGGDLSWVEPGQMVPPFDKAAFALKQPNELSPVVETRFGYHIIQLVERQESQTVPFEQAKARIGMVLRDEKVKEALRAHVQDLKTKAKVETYI